MSGLAELQRSFQAWVIEGDEGFAAEVNASSRVPVETRLRVYSDAYRLRLIEALQSNYPMLHQVLGDEVFEQLASGYIAAHPSTFKSIRWFGNQLGSYLAASEDWSQHAWLEEFAQWEWAVTMAFDAANAGPLDPSSLSSVDPEDWPQLRFELHPSVHRMQLDWNIAAMFKCLVADEMPPEPELNASRSDWLIWRRGLATQYRGLEAPEAFALELLAGGGTFGEMCEGLGRWLSDEEVPLKAASFLKVWIGDGVIVAASV
jgi:hypothetical protein